MAGRTLAMSRSSAGCSSLSRDDLHAKELTRGIEDLLVYFHGAPLAGESLDAGPRHGADEFRNVREPRFGGGCPPASARLPELLGLLLLVARNHCRKRTAAAGRTRRSRFDFRA